MFKFTIFAMCLVAAWAIPTGEKEPVPIVSQESDVDVDGTFHYSYESGDGSKVQQAGELKQVDKDNAGEAIHGMYEYTGDDGKVYHVEYTADENGFQPHGDHIPEVPEAIVKALKYIEEHPHQEEQHHHQH